MSKKIHFTDLTLRDGQQSLFATRMTTPQALRVLKKIDQATLVGQALAERAKEKGISSVVFDRGGFRYMGRVKALADGARKGGLEF